jgi:hypothetical protein
MANTHVQPDLMAELTAIHADLLAPAILATTLAVPVPGSMVLPAFTTQGYVRNGTPARLTYVNQPAATVTLAGGDGAYWLALHADTSTVLSGWTRRAGSHYAWQAAGTQPADPPGGLVMASATVAGGVITAVSAAVNYPATKVAYGGSNGALAFDAGLTYEATGNTLTVQGPAVAYGHVVSTRAGDNVIAFHTDLAAAGGSERYAVLAGGTAPSYFGGPVQVTTQLGVGIAPVANVRVYAANNPASNAIGFYTTQAAGPGAYAWYSAGTAPAYFGGPVQVIGTASTGALTVTGTLSVTGAGSLASLALTTPLPLTSGGTQATTAAGARTNLGLGTMAVQNANAVSISGGDATLANAAITLLSVNGGVQGGYQLSVTGQSWFSSTVQVQGALNTAGGSTLSGAVGIGAVNPGAYTLYVQGNARIVTDLLVSNQAYKPGNGMWADSASMREFKQNIRDYTGGLATLLGLRERQWEWKPEYPELEKTLPGTQMGFVVEEVAPVQPRWVIAGPPGGGEKALQMHGFPALVVSALRELTQRLEALEPSAEGGSDAATA